MNKGKYIITITVILDVYCCCTGGEKDEWGGGGVTVHVTVSLYMMFLLIVVLGRMGRVGSHSD